MKSFEQGGFVPQNEQGNEKREGEMDPIEGPLQELLPIHFTSEQIFKLKDLLKRGEFSLDNLPPMGETYARDTLIPLITEFFELTDVKEQGKKGKEIVEALQAL